MTPPYPTWLFTGQRIIDEAHQITSIVCSRIAVADLPSLTAKPVDGLVQDLYNDHYIELPRLHRNDAVHDTFEFYFAPYLTVMHNIDFKTLNDQRRGPIFALDVPFSGDARYLRTRPTATALKPPLAHIGEQKLTLYVPKETDSSDYVQRRFNSMLDNIEGHLKASFDSLTSWPRNFQGNVTHAIEQRIAQLKSAEKISSGLTFKLKPRGDAPKTYIAPLVRKKLVTLQPAKPTRANAAPPKPVIDEQAYADILDIIKNMTIVMERSPHSFATMGEEDIRQHFLVQLNAQFEGAATGETFNYTGKTDILVRVESRNVFIAECKFWSGPKAFTETIDQLLGYLSWRDNKAAVIVFNRNRDFSAVLSGIEQAANSHAYRKSGPTRQSPTQLRYVFGSPADRDRDVILTIVAFDVPST
ncbi:hypothetical protein ABIF73_000833 [Bradyrhizobium japonicum]|uniref:hypothetical protein n=1 Tax=Bradyrhizobium japonicum TaxID=375 RepID=UPI003393CDB8